MTDIQRFFIWWCEHGCHIWGQGEDISKSAKKGLCDLTKLAPVVEEAYNEYQPVSPEGV